MSWLFSQALVEAFSADTCSAGALCAQLNVMPTAQPFWRNDKTMDACRFSRFGLTLQLLTDDHGGELLTSYLAAFPARISASQVQEQDSLGADQGSGASSRESFATYDRDLSSWKTAQRSLLGDSELFSQTWPRSGSMRNGVCSVQPPLAHPIGGIASGLWPTPTVHGNYNRKGLSAQSGDGLATTVRNFPTPTVAMHKGSSAGALTRINGRSRKNDRLDYAIEGDASNGRLNPEWVEWLMGWPIGWTALQPLAMDRFREWQQQHGEV